MSDVSVAERDAGVTTAVFRVSLSRPAPKRLRLRYSTKNATADSGADYLRRTGGVVFKKGSRTAKARVFVLGDTLDEADETFEVRIRRGRGARVRLGDPVAIARIADDDGPAGTPPPLPFNDRTQATFVLDFREMKIQQCLSPNDGRSGDPPPGIYAELETQYDGTVISEDRRLAGKIELLGRGLARAEPDDGPFLPDTGQSGIVQGPFTITAAADGRKTRGTFFATVGRSASPADPGVLQFEGLLTGGVDFLPESRRDPSNDTDFDGGTLIGNFRGSSSNWTADQVRGDIGGLPPADDAEQPAFIVGGDCGGPVQTRKRGDPPFAPMPGPPAARTQR